MQLHNRWTADLKGTGHTLGRLLHGSQLWYVTTPVILCLKLAIPQWTSPIHTEGLMFVGARGAAAPRPPPPLSLTTEPIHPQQSHRWLERDTAHVQPDKRVLRHKPCSWNTSPHRIHKLPQLRGSSPSFLCTLRPETASPHQRHLFLRPRLTFWSPMSPLRCSGATRAANTARFSPPSPGFLAY